MSTKTWKDHLLSSGLPLEHSVAQALGKLGMIDPREFRYTRANEHGVLTTFSVDVHAECLISNPNIWLELFVECKYHHDSTNWVFAPSEYDWFGPEFAELFVSLETLDSGHQLNKELLNKYSKNYPLCTKGVELFTGDATHATIERALSQLKYAVPHRAARALNGLVATNNPSPTIVLVPIIVTTASLWRLKPTVSVEGLRAANELAEVASAEEIVVVHQLPDNDLSAYTADVFNRELSGQARTHIDQFRPSGGTDAYVNGLAQWLPSTFIVIHYSRFFKAIDNLMRFLDRTELVVPRKPAVHGASS